MSNYSLIVPLLCDCTDKIPIEYYMNNQYYNCIASIMKLPLNTFDNIYFTVSKEHDKLLNVGNNILFQIDLLKQNKLINNNCNIHIYISEKTKSQSETVYNTIKHFNIQGPIFIKDGDNECDISDSTIIPGNSVLVYSLEDMIHQSIDTTHKSYVTIDNNMVVTNIIEKRVVSDLFNCGAYIFDDANDFTKAYIELISLNNAAHIYISNIIYYLILYYNKIFRIVKASYYNDYKIKTNYE